ncbi:RNA polymerase sigma-70 factor [Mucilaginibacter angelicae]|uniref:RNA polymerase sigma-70 factor n=1 Tax=Mucilaginibacter angelicae TaxID=869718 RepID=A0ABV6L578_9SPHI
MANYKIHNDNLLFELLQDSDHLAYNEIFRRYFQLIFVHAYKKVRDEQLAKDVVQEVFAGLWFKRESMQIGSNLAGYLFTAVRNRIFDLFAHERVKGKYVESLGDFMDNCRGVPADYQVREREMAAYIEKQVAALPPKMRRIFELSRKDFLSHREIAEELGTSQANVSKQLSNALRILRAKLGMFISFFFMLMVFMVIVLMTTGRGMPAPGHMAVVFTFCRAWEG